MGTSKLLMQGAELNDTATVTFANVVVPEHHLIGRENEGFKPLMQNFNYERFMVCCDMVSSQRRAIEESVRWAKERETFGRKDTSIARNVALLKVECSKALVYCH